MRSISHTCVERFYLKWVSKYKHITNASRGTANAWHLYYALVFVITVLCVKLVVALAAP
ncbi:DUF3265 domain-containing protein [Vibrio anguillarum]|uniref:DUF3265 domain-containing protein n=1 Tax=Vibrio anguillarum TaxID=55601 RepID=A0AAW4BDJ8_VIBAN|nr:DUF3265 domain-containing protein [Vibrio anguillarum]